MLSAVAVLGVAFILCRRRDEGGNKVLIIRQKQPVPVPHGSPSPARIDNFLPAAQPVVNNELNGNNNTASATAAGGAVSITPVYKTTAVNPSLEWDNFSGRAPVGKGRCENPMYDGQTLVGTTAADDAAINTPGTDALYDTVDPSLERDNNPGRAPVATGRTQCTLDIPMFDLVGEVRNTTRNTTHV